MGVCIVSDIEYKLRVFGFGLLQDLISLTGVLEREGISLEEVKEYVEERQRQLKETKLAMQKANEKVRQQWEKNTRRCPTCVMPLMARSITIKKGKANIKGYTCHWFCQEENCNFEEYTYEDFQIIYKKIMGGR